VEVVVRIGDAEMPGILGGVLVRMPDESSFRLGRDTLVFTFSPTKEDQNIRGCGGMCVR